MSDLQLISAHAPRPDISGATTDDQLIAMWLSGRPATTVRAYTADIFRLREHIEKPLRRITAADLIGWTDTLGRLKPASQYRVLSAVKSLFSFSMRVGYIEINPAAALQMPRNSRDVANKLLSVEAVKRIIQHATGRNRLLIRTLYLLGLRESELIRLRAENIYQTNTGYAVSVTGKGTKVRHLAMPSDLARDLLANRASGALFPINASTVYRIVRFTGEAAGYRISPHSLRHFHASHALDSGAALALVRDSLGHASIATTSVYLHAKPSDGSALYLADE